MHAGVAGALHDRLVELVAVHACASDRDRAAASEVCLLIVADARASRCPAAPTSPSGTRARRPCASGSGSACASAAHREDEQRDQRAPSSRSEQRADRGRRRSRSNVELLARRRRRRTPSSRTSRGPTDDRVARRPHALRDRRARHVEQQPVGGRGVEAGQDVDAAAASARCSSGSSSTRPTYWPPGSATRSSGTAPSALSTCACCSRIVVGVDDRLAPAGRVERRSACRPSSGIDCTIRLAPSST